MNTCKTCRHYYKPEWLDTLAAGNQVTEYTGATHMCKVDGPNSTPGHVYKVMTNSDGCGKWEMK